MRTGPAAQHYLLQDSSHATAAVRVCADAAAMLLTVTWMQIRYIDALLPRCHGYRRYQRPWTPYTATPPRRPAGSACAQPRGWTLVTPPPVGTPPAVSALLRVRIRHPVGERARVARLNVAKLSFEPNCTECCEEGDCKKAHLLGMQWALHSPLGVMF